MITYCEDLKCNSPFLLSFQVVVSKKSEIHYCQSITDPHYTALHPQGNGELVFFMLFYFRVLCVRIPKGMFSAVCFRPASFNFLIDHSVTWPGLPPYIFDIDIAI